MIGNISSIQSGTFVAQYSGVGNAPPQSKAATAPVEDTVQFSSQLQGILAASKQDSAPSSLTLNQIIKEAANGDISALARLTLIA